MAISTYLELKTAVANWLERSDLTDRIPDFVTLAESRINRLFRGRLAEINAGLTGVVGGRTIALPAAFSEPVALWIARPEGREGLRFVDPALLDVRAGQGEPRCWTIEGGSLGFDRACDQAYGFTLRHLAKYGLSEVAPTNALLSDYPDIYLFGALVEAAPYLRDAEMLALFAARFDAALAEANHKEGRSRTRSTLASEIADIERSGRGADFRC